MSLPTLNISLNDNKENVPPNIHFALPESTESSAIFSELDSDEISSVISFDAEPTSPTLKTNQNKLLKINKTSGEWRALFLSQVKPKKA